MDRSDIKAAHMEDIPQARVARRATAVAKKEERRVRLALLLRHAEECARIAQARACALHRQNEEACHPTIWWL